MTHLWPAVAAAALLALTILLTVRLALRAVKDGVPADDVVRVLRACADLFGRLVRRDRPRRG